MNVRVLEYSFSGFSCGSLANHAFAILRHQRRLRLDLPRSVDAQIVSGHLIVTGSCFGIILRCFAVADGHQGDGLLNEVVGHLMEVQVNRGNTHVFLYTKPQSAAYFADLGFYEIARVEETLVFMENRQYGFSDYLSYLRLFRRKGSAAAVVMNANPFTLGHRYSVECGGGFCHRPCLCSQRECRTHVC